jgi:hypothetical protein
MSYAFDAVEVHAQGASYIDRILKGLIPPTSRFSSRRNIR